MPCASAARRDNRITLRVDALRKHPVFVLTGISRVKEVTGGTAETKDYGLVVTPDCGEVVVAL